MALGWAVWITLSCTLQVLAGTAAVPGDEAACQQGLYVANVEVPFFRCLKP